MEADFNEKLADYGILLRRLLVNKTLQIDVLLQTSSLNQSQYRNTGNYTDVRHVAPQNV